MTASPVRAVVYLHGGGYATGTVEAFAALSPTSLAPPAHGCSQSTTGWRPSTRFPAAVDDAVAAYRFVLSAGYAAGGHRARR